MIDKFIIMAQNAGASDLHLTADSAPVVRVLGRLEKLQAQILTDDDIAQYVKYLLQQKNLQYSLECGEMDISYITENNIRCRVNVYKQNGKYAVAIRIIPNKIKSLAELGLPVSLSKFAFLKYGLVLVTGSTGSGKSTTLASLIELINERQPYHILTLEDPVEYRHCHKQAIINQREIGVDTQSFASGLRSALREDPDVILVGEMRDKETVEAALTAAETGHLVFSTLHTHNAAATINRIIDMVPDKQQQVRNQLADTLQGIIAQELVYSSKVNKMLPVVEVMTATNAIKNLIREGKDYQIPSYIQTGAQYGMITRDEYLRGLKKRQLL